MKTILLLLAVFAASQAHPNRKNSTETNSDGSLLTRMQFPSAENCVCVPLYQCGGPVISQDHYGSRCRDSNNVCCGRSYITPNAPLPTPPSANEVCGARNTEDFSSFRIMIDEEESEAKFAEFPWVAAILNRQDLSYKCSGSLVQPQLVLTAAHCVRNSTDFIVRLGEWNLQNTDEPLSHQDKRIIKTVIHPKFRRDTIHHDFALLFLDSPVGFAGNVGTICLPESSDVFDGSRCLVAGWGKSVHGKAGTYHPVLKKVEVPIVNHDTCQNNLRQTHLRRFFNLHSSFICAGGEAGKDACSGDGGAPLMCPHPQYPTYYTQAGIVSWGIGCGSQNVPGVYSNVAYAREWINQQYSENFALLKN